LGDGSKRPGGRYAQALAEGRKVGVCIRCFTVRLREEVVDIKEICPGPLLENGAIEQHNWAVATSDRALRAIFARYRTEREAHRARLKKLAKELKDKLGRSRASR